MCRLISLYTLFRKKAILRRLRNGNVKKANCKFMVCETSLFGVSVEFIVDFFEVLVRDVGVDLGGGNVGVAEHGLDGAEIGAIHEQVGGEAVA